jgi:membrane-bound lytic murein transglycosylase D
LNQALKMTTDLHFLLNGPFCCITIVSEFCAVHQGVRGGMVARTRWLSLCGAVVLTAQVTAVPAQTAATPAAASVALPAAASIALPVSTPFSGDLPVAAGSQPAAPDAAASINVPAAADATASPSLALPPVTGPVTLDMSHAASVADPSALFTRPPELRTAIAFWTDIFGKYSENQSVVHSIDDLGKVYMVLDFRDQAATLNPVRLEHVREAAEHEARAHVDTMLKHIDALQATPDKLSADERRIYDLFASSSDPKRFRREIGNERVQRGLKERTDHALETATSYLPQMEHIFARYNLPPQLTRLPLVESSFNVDAYSKDGAAGVWQFIPSSARIYMRLDDIVDDRRDIWYSTDAAARHLRDDYDALRNWPLAVTAYNHGRGGLARGLIAVQGTTLSDLLKRWHNANFGFASRNFYAEFLAASDVDRTWRAQHPLTGSRGDTMHYDSVAIRDYLPYDTVRQLAGLDEETFHTLNPAYKPEVVSGKLYVPPGHEIRVPAGAAAQFAAAYEALPASERYAHQRLYYATYVVRRGDTLGKLARRYGVSTTAILAANGMRPHTPIHAGRAIRIPPHDDGTVVAQAAPAPHLVSVAQTATAATTAQYLLHKIRSGQTLGEIAKHYRTSVDELMKLNALTDTRHLRPGMTIKIPAVE